jgi:hypothetical protein
MQRGGVVFQAVYPRHKIIDDMHAGYVDEQPEDDPRGNAYCAKEYAFIHYGCGDLLLRCADAF